MKQIKLKIEMNETYKLTTLTRIIQDYIGNGKVKVLEATRV